MAQTQKNYLNILYLKVAESNFYIGSFIQIYVYTCVSLNAAATLNILGNFSEFVLTVYIPKKTILY